MRRKENAETKELLLQQHWSASLTVMRGVIALLLLLLMLLLLLLLLLRVRRL